jgi:hypothetical protein
MTLINLKYVEQGMQQHKAHNKIETRIVKYVRTKVNNKTTNIWHKVQYGKIKDST